MENKMYYIQNSGYIGNAMIWWRKGGKGYTSYIADAGRFSEKEMHDIIDNRPEDDMAWECDYIDNNLEIRKTIIESQNIDFEKQIKGKRI